jgi:HAD superfamily hydrolase (TIGR01509 family)
MKDYQAYLFDWDGTLARTLEEWLRLLRDAYLAYGIELDDKTIIGGFGNWKAAIDFGLAEEHYAAYRAEIGRKSHAALSQAPLYEGSRELLTTLRSNNKQLGLLTSSSSETIHAVLQFHGLDTMFDVVITGDDVEKHKPDPECIVAALDALHLDPAQAVMVGDSDKDLGAATNAEIDSILYFPDTHNLFYELEELKKLDPTYVISNWSELQ